MKNTHKIVASLAGVALLIAAAAIVVVSFWAFSQIKESAKARKHAFVVINSANDLLSKLIDAETGQRGYLLTGDKAFLEPYLAVRDSISGHLKELRQLTLISAAHKHLDALPPLVDAKLAEISHVIELRRNHDMSAVVAIVSSGRGKRLMDSIRAEMKSLTQIEEGALEQHDAEFQANMRHLLIVIVTISLLTLLLALSFAYLIYRETQQRLKNFALLETQHLLEIQEDTNKQLQQANVTLQVSEEKLAVTLNSIGDAVMAIDAEGHVTLLNPLAEQLTGWTQAEATGRPVDEIFRIINQETRQPSTIPAMETLAHGTIHGLANHTILIARAGSECVIDDSCAPIRNRDGQVVGAVLVFRDVTEKKKLERGVVKARDVAEASNKELAAFSYSVSHDLRAPLRGIDGFSEALLDDYRDKLDATGKNYLERIRAGTQRMGSLIDDLLKLSRVSRAELKRESVDLSKMVQAILLTVRQNNPARDVKVSIQKDIIIDGDRHLLGIALTNLIDNAWKFTGKTKNARIEFGTLLKDGKPVIFIRDNGVGFDMAYVDKLFGAFQRLHTIAEFPGTGIGLANVQRVIHRHGGKIWAEGEVGKGATFYFTIPAEFVSRIS